MAKQWKKKGIDMERKKIIGERLRELRGDRSMAEIAELVEVSAMAICRYEHGDMVPADDVKLKLATLYGTTVEALFFSF